MALELNQYAAIVGIQGPAGPAGPAGANGAAGATGATGPAWVPPFRKVSGTSDTPTSADHLGLIAYTSNSPINVTANDLGEGKSYAVTAWGDGALTIVAGSGVTLVSGSGGTSFRPAYEGGVLTVVCKGDGTVYVNGLMAE